MAEIQWVVEVRCVNTLLAEFKVGERGQHICIHVPDRVLDPHEFGKLIQGARAASRIAEEHRSARQKAASSQAIRPSLRAEPQAEGSAQAIRPSSSEPPAPLEAELGTVSEVQGRVGLYEIQILKTGEIALVNIPGAVLGPTEFDQFVAELKTIQSRLGPP